MSPDVENLDLVEIGPAFLEVVRVALAGRTHARLPGRQHEGAGADARIPSRAFRAGRDDRQMVVGHQEGEIGAAVAQGEHDLALPVRLDVGDAGDGAGSTGGGTFATVVVDRVDHILRVERLAVMELDALSKVEHPYRCVVRGFPAFRQLPRDVAVRGDHGQVVSAAPRREDVVGVKQGRAGQRIGGGAAAYRQAEAAPTFRFRRFRRLGQQAGRYRSPHADGGCAIDELAPAEAAFGQAALQIVERFHGWFSTGSGFRCGAVGPLFRHRTPDMDCRTR